MDNNHDSHFPCVICVDECVAISSTICGHNFCKGCLVSWIQTSLAAGRKPACPLCSQAIDVAPESVQVNKELERLLLSLKQQQTSTLAPTALAPASEPPTLSKLALATAPPTPTPSTARASENRTPEQTLARIVVESLPVGTEPITSETVSARAHFERVLDQIEARVAVTAPPSLAAESTASVAEVARCASSTKEPHCDDEDDSCCAKSRSYSAAIDARAVPQCDAVPQFYSPSASAPVSSSSSPSSSSSVTEAGPGQRAACADTASQASARPHESSIQLQVGARPHESTIQLQVDSSDAQARAAKSDPQVGNSSGGTAQTASQLQLGTSGNFDAAAQTTAYPAHERAVNQARADAAAIQRIHERVEQQARADAAAHAAAFQRAREEAERHVRSQAAVLQRAHESAEKQARADATAVEAAYQRARNECERHAAAQDAALQRARENAEKLNRAAAAASQKAREDAEKQSRAAAAASLKAREDAEKQSRAAAAASHKAREDAEKQSRAAAASALKAPTHWPFLW